MPEIHKVLLATIAWSIDEKKLRLYQSIGASTAVS